MEDDPETSDRLATPIPGAQSVRRGLQVLRVLADHQATGLRMSDLVRLTGLTRSTAHRLLVCLEEEGFVEQNAATRRYALGADSMRIGFAAMRRMPIVDRVRPLMLRLSRITSDAVFLLMRQGDEVVCLHREIGAVPADVFSIEVGASRLLGRSVAGLALLASQRDSEIDSHFVRHRPAYEKAGVDRRTLWQRVDATRRAGFSEVRDAITRGVFGIGAALPPSSCSQAAITIGNLSARLKEAHRAEVSRALLSNVRRSAAG